MTNEEDFKGFKVGDVVAIFNYWDQYIATADVIKVSPKRGDITVKTRIRKAESTYKSDGYQRVGGYERASYIVHLTDEVKKEIADTRVVSACKQYLKKVEAKLTPDMARDLLKVMKKYNIVSVPKPVDTKEA